MYNTTDVGNIAVYAIAIYLFLAIIGLPGAGAMILSLGIVAFTAMALMK